MTVKRIAIDIGMTNIDLVVDDSSNQRFLMLTNPGGKVSVQLRYALESIESDLIPDMPIGVTGGRYRDLPDALDGYQILKVDEILALGLGGLRLANLDQGLIVSAGTGVAMVAARQGEVEHVTGSAVGGGTLLGLARLILGTSDVFEIDRLALDGDASAVDIMLSEAVGGEIGRLPAYANAVNLGKLDQPDGFLRENLAAGLVRLVAQVIAVIAINAANAADLSEIIIVGHLMDLKSIRNEINLVGVFYDQSFIIPENPGFGTAIGVIEALKQV